MIKLESTALP